MERLISMLYLSQVSSQSFVINTVTVLVWFARGEKHCFSCEGSQGSSRPDMIFYSSC